MFSFGVCALELFNFSHAPAEAAAGNPYNTTFQMRVQAEEHFSGQGVWECDIAQFRVFVRELEEMAQFRRETVELLDIGYASRIRFQMDRLGHIKVDGTIYGSGRVQSVTFEWRADQTALDPFLKGLTKLLKTAGE